MCAISNHVRDGDVIKLEHIDDFQLDYLAKLNGIESSEEKKRVENSVERTKK